MGRGLCKPASETQQGGTFLLYWLITLLANQSVLIQNLQNPAKKQELLTEEAVELLTSPLELGEYKNAIMDAMYKGTKRHVESEEDASSKNAQVG